MRLIPRPRWRVGKYGKLSGKRFTRKGKQRRYWLRSSAQEECARLLVIANQSGLPYTYKVERIYGRATR